jgi:hypothetical protein
LFAGLVLPIFAVGEEGEGRGVGRPGNLAFAAELARRCGGGDALDLAQVIERGDADLLPLNPGEAFAVWGDGDLAEEVAVVDAAQDLFDAVVGGRRRVLSGDGEGGAEEQGGGEGRGERLAEGG